MQPASFYLPTQIGGGRDGVVGECVLRLLTDERLSVKTNGSLRTPERTRMRCEKPRYMRRKT